MSDRRLDEKTRKALIGVMPFTQNGSIEYTPEIFEELPEDKRPVFIQRAFTKAENSDVRKKIDTEAGISENDAMEYSRKTVLGWRNVFDLATSEEIDYKSASDNGADKELYSEIPTQIISKLFRNALVMSGILQIEKLGLESLPPSTSE